MRPNGRSALSPTDKDAVLAGIISSDDPIRIAEFRQRALKFFQQQKAGQASSQTGKPLEVGTLLLRAQTIRDQRHQLEAEKRAKAKAQRQRKQRQQQIRTPGVAHRPGENPLGPGRGSHRRPSAEALRCSRRGAPGFERPGGEPGHGRIICPPHAGPGRCPQSQTHLDRAVPEGETHWIDRSGRKDKRLFRPEGANSSRWQDREGRATDQGVIFYDTPARGECLAPERNACHR